jgi:hypothetical protein
MKTKNLLQDVTPALRRVEKIREDKSIKDTGLRQPSAASNCGQPVDNAMKEVMALGLPIYALIGRYRKLSKLAPKIPDEVILRVCGQFTAQRGHIVSPWPWFLRVLQSETEKYMANRNIQEHAEFKKDGGLSLKEILKRASA